MTTYTENDFFQSPYSYYEQLRQVNEPMLTTLHGHEGWFITSYDKAVEILKNPLFVSAVPTPKTALAKVQKQMVLFKNGADHSRLRAILASAFTKEAINNIKSTVVETADLLLAQLQKKQDVEIISDYAFPLSTAVIAKLLGITIHRLEDLRKWSNLLVQTVDFSRNQTNLRAGRQALLEIYAFFKPILAARAAAPKDDVISKFVQLLHKDRSLSFEELMANCILLLIAGQETTVNLISTGILLLINHPEQRQLLQEQPRLINGAIEEILRFESPTQLLARVASEDVHFHERFIQKGERVYILIGAANRDCKQFPAANTFDITRTNNRHLAFGYGEHFCIGAMLARIEGQIAVQRFFEQFPNTRLSNKEVTWRELVGFRALKQLHCKVK